MDLFGSNDDPPKRGKAALKSSKSSRGRGAVAPPTSGGASAPLAARMRPRSLDDFVGQDHLLAPGKALRELIEQDAIGSIIFWGPPGTGKTTLARIIAERTSAAFVHFKIGRASCRERV